MPTLIHIRRPMTGGLQCERFCGGAVVGDDLDDAKRLAVELKGRVCYHCWNIVDPDGIPAKCEKCGKAVTVGELKFGAVCDFCYMECGGDDGDQ